MVAGSRAVSLAAKVASRLAVGLRVGVATVGQAVSASLGWPCCWGLDTTAEGGSPASLPAGVGEGREGGGDGVETVEKLILAGVESEGENGLRGNAWRCSRPTLLPICSRCDAESTCAPGPLASPYHAHLSL